MYSSSYLPVYYAQGSVSSVEVDVNHQVGYKWYQSSLSSDMVNTNSGSSCSCGCQISIPLDQVSNPHLYYSVEYRPPPAPPHLFHSTEPPPSELYNTEYSAQQMFDVNSGRSPILIDETFNSAHTSLSNTLLFTLTCHTTLSTGQLYYGIGTTTVEQCSEMTTSVENLNSANRMFDVPSISDVNEVDNCPRVFSENVVVSGEGSKLLEMEQKRCNERVVEDKSKMNVVGSSVEISISSKLIGVEDPENNSGMLNISTLDEVAACNESGGMNRQVSKIGSFLKEVVEDSDRKKKGGEDGVEDNTDEVTRITRFTQSYVTFMGTERLRVDVARIPVNTITVAKGLNEQRFGEILLQSDMILWPFSVVSSVKIEIIGEVMSFVADEMPSMFLKKMREMIKNFLDMVAEKNVIYDPGGGTFGMCFHTAKKILVVEDAGMKSDTELKELELQVETCIDMSNSVKDLSGGIDRGGKQIDAKLIHPMIFDKNGEMVETFIDSTYNIVIVPAGLDDSQMQTTKKVGDISDIYMMWIITESTVATIAHALMGKKFKIVSNENVLIFDPGGYMHNRQPTRIFSMSKEMCAAFDACGFKPCDVTRSDLLSEALSGDKFSRFMLVGGLKYVLALDYANVKPASILVTQHRLDQFQVFKICSQTIIFGVWQVTRQYAIKCATIMMPGCWKDNVTLDGFIGNQIPQKVAWRGSLFNTMNHKGTRGLICNQGEIALYASVVISCYITFGDSFELHRMLYMYEEQKFGMSLFKTLALAWYWSAITLVFDPGDLSCYHSVLQISIILEDKDILSRRDCNDWVNSQVKVVWDLEAIITPLGLVISPGLKAQMEPIKFGYMY